MSKCTHVTQGCLQLQITAVFSLVTPEKLESEKLNVAEVTQSEIAQKQKLQTVLEKINETLKLPPRSIKWNVDCELYNEKWDCLSGACGPYHEVSPRSCPVSWQALCGCKPIDLFKEGHISSYIPLGKITCQNPVLFPIKGFLQKARVRLGREGNSYSLSCLCMPDKLLRMRLSPACRGLGKLRSLHSGS